MKISLVGAFNLADGYLGAANALRRKGIEVNFVPAYQYRSEIPKKHVEQIADDLMWQAPDVVLWWRAETLRPIELLFVKNKINAKHIMFSWDDPFQWEANDMIAEKSKYLDCAFTCCKDSVGMYLKNGAKKAVYCLPGFDPEVHYPEVDENYVCDVSIVCTNLYHGTSLTRNHHISRKTFLDTIIEKLPDIDLRIYGSEGFKDLYGDRYKGWVSFNESRKVFCNSKINICTHIGLHGDGYLNERTTQILGSRGLLFVDHVKGIEANLIGGKECVIIHEQNFINQIKSILGEYDKYLEVKENGYQTALKNLSWDSWAEKILENV